jgi:phosphatidylglycerol:prolipoprotein diacylglycerol transferase
MLPILFQNHDLTIYSYPLLMGIGWGVAYQVFFYLLSEDFSRLKGQTLFWGIFLSAWIGAKFLFYLTYPSASEKSFVSDLSFWMGGGFVFYGGFLGALLFLALFKILFKKLSLNDLWPMLPALALGHGIGRIGCFLAGCCFGKPTELFWGVFMHEHYRHPTQLIEASGLIALGIYLLKSNASKPRLISLYLVFYGLLRFGVEALRGDMVRGSWGLLTPSQWISLLLITSGILVFARILRG